MDREVYTRMYQKGQYLKLQEVLNSVDSETPAYVDILKCKMYLELNDYQKLDQLIRDLKQRYDNDIYIFTQILLEELYLAYRLDNASRVNKLVEEITKNIQILEAKQDEENGLIVEIKALFMYLKGNIEWRKNNPEYAISLYRKSKTYYDMSGNLYGQVQVLNGLGNIFRRTHDYQSAQQFYQQTYQLADKFQFKKFIIYSTSNLGDLYRLKGLLGLAEKFLLIAFDHQKQYSGKETLAVIMNNLGIVYYHRGLLQKANEYLEQALKILHQLDNRHYLSETIFYLVMISSHRNQDERRNNYLSLLKSNEEQLQGIAKLRLELIELLISKNKHWDLSELKKFVKRKLRSYFEEQVTIEEIQIITILNICELIIDRYQNSNQDRLLGIVEEIVDRINEIASKQNFSWVKMEVYYLHARINRINHKFHLANIYYRQSYSIAQQFSYHFRENQIKKELYDLLSEQPLLALEKKISSDLSQQLQKELNLLVASNQQLLVQPDEAGHTLEYYSIFLEPLALRIFKLLYTSDSMTVDALVNYLNASSGTVKRLLNKMENKDLILFTTSGNWEEKVQLSVLGYKKFEDFLLQINWD